MRRFLRAATYYLSVGLETISGRSSDIWWERHLLVSGLISRAEYRANIQAIRSNRGRQGAASPTFRADREGSWPPRTTLPVVFLWAAP